MAETIVVLAPAHKPCIAGVYIVNGRKVVIR